MLAGLITPPGPSFVMAAASNLGPAAALYLLEGNGEAATGPTYFVSLGGLEN